MKIELLFFKLRASELVMLTSQPNTLVQAELSLNHYLPPFLFSPPLSTILIPKQGSLGRDGSGLDVTNIIGIVDSAYQLSI